MGFFTEPRGYQKTILSDLQGAWSLFRASVVDSGGFPNADRVLFHTDEAMSWETVRHLHRMPPLFAVIRNLCIQGGASEDVMAHIEDIAEILQDTELPD